MSNAIEFKNVWKKFKKGEKFNSLRDSIPNFFRRLSAKTVGKQELEDREFWAVKDVSFEVKKGEVVGVIGPNGAGKSTILKLLSRIMEPNEGSMSINGRLSALIEVTAGFHPELTGRENVYLNGTILGMKKKELDAKFDQIVEFSGLDEFIDTPIKRYSSGMFSRLGFSVAAHVDPDVLLVDEVLAVGDIAFQAKCAKKMRELLESGTTIMLVSHNLQLVQSLCKRVILLNKGEVMKEGSPDEVIPYYEEIVFHQQEQDFKQNVKKTSDKVKVNTEGAVSISEVRFNGKLPKDAEPFQVGDTISISIDYETNEEIPTPVFCLKLIRADGVLCYTVDTRNEKIISAETVNGKGQVTIELNKIPLAPGNYLAQLSIWDKNLLHPYVIRWDDFFKVDSLQSGQRFDGVYVPDVNWSA